MAIKPVTGTARTVSGKRVTVGGVTVTVELDEGELNVRVGRVSPDAEGERIAVSPDGAGHVNFLVEGAAPGEAQHARFRVHSEGGSRRRRGLGAGYGPFVRAETAAAAEAAEA